MSIFLTALGSLLLLGVLVPVLIPGLDLGIQILIVLVSVGFAFTLCGVAAIIAGLNKAGIKAR